MKQITVYTTPDCRQCRLTKTWLTDREIPFETVDLSESPADLAAVRELGYASAPVIVVSTGNPENDLHWYGFHPDFLTRYATTEAAA
ncbi:glutaredoxin domain-containing protein [Arthrobacter luteolus]|uniref:glutaredoxin domain-containing protein n=1 Tax=Arthrobacter luteolus TaxID=98672 RepID=UPI000830760C|nr:glutaredoxin domain-containing protein [Arthrobacter luteolus]